MNRDSAMETGGESDPHPWKKRALVALNSLRDNAAEDRETSLRLLNDLSGTRRGNAPGTQAAQKIWEDRFDTFRTVTLAQDIKDCPTGQDLERFILIMPKRLKGMNRAVTNGAIAEGTMQYGLRSIVASLRIRYPSFNLGKYEETRMRNAMKYMVEQKHLTREPYREDPLWITSDVVRTMCMAMMQDALDNGVLSWDNTISRVMYLCFQTALAARMGDITRSGHYTSDECLSFKDVKIRLRTMNDGKERLWAVITLRYIKGFKAKPSKNQVIELGEVQDPNLNLSCPIKLLIIWALRVGAVPESNYTDLMAAVRARPSRAIVWSEPDFPVFCALIKGKSLTLDFAKPAGPNFGKAAIDHGARVTGMIVRPLTHDIRRGAAREISYLDVQGPTPNKERVRAALNHGKDSFDVGVTDSYIGGDATDWWELRLKARPLTGMQHLIEFADAPYRPPKHTANEIDELCAKFKLDPKNPSARMKAATWNRRDHRAAWVKETTAKRNEATSETNPLKRKAESLTAVSHPRGIVPQEGEGPESDDIGYWDSGMPIDPELTAGGLGEVSHSPGIVPQPGEGPESDDIGYWDSDTSIDLELTEWEDTGSGLSSAPESTSVPSDEATMSDIAPSHAAILTAQGPAFIEFFSRINAVKTGKNSSYQISGTGQSISGTTSRAVASKFQVACTNAKFGCTRVYLSPSAMATHYKTCAMTGPTTD
ncbi:hypothetical protein AK830_g9628 [Neonectria ditissima]|uniref:Uncharacterized protein n=1 Tax=Neonectria ditissima TaxID=78410 RepID=A0A0P7B907_9HYPO|nr:hypothetical protein AK830_g9628 [Neonectria ditissima]